MIDWLSFLTVLVVAIVSASVIVFLFSVGLRLVAVEGGWHRPVGVVSFVLCALLILFGVYLIIPGLH
ncbi:hypothetical protein [Glaciihabitans sp. UYNi722]|uniref:hypothetical protein n=1 Tax=Glaciihabitans sp. UYNi722 TaxID=3156344 RepID=UPI003392E369